ncbi:MAG: hypothetical protein GF331_17010 [Chitinivibrionales bacterium]|nr:hypothetical protein [Chitinivibrionales bacterium]
MNEKLMLPIAIPSAAVLVSAGVVLYAGARWKRQTARFRERMLTCRRCPGVDRFDPADIEALPAPVKRYLNTVLSPGQPLVTAAWFSQDGTFRLRRNTKNPWVHLTATQAVTTVPSAFDWRARMMLAPGLSIFVQDSYFRGVGELHATVRGLVPVMQAADTPQLNSSELVRFLAEAPWYPTVLLPGHGITWEPLTDSSARAVLTDCGLRVAVEFHFDESGLVNRTSVPSRFRMTDDGGTQAPWQGRFWDYREVSGMRVPTKGEVAWVLPDGPQPYWRATVTPERYEYCGQSSPTQPVPSRSVEAVY